MKQISIGCAAGFWGDTETAAAQLVQGGDLDYLVFDYLAEITMSILAKARQKDERGGWATDFVTRSLGPLLPQVKEQGIKVVSNAGGLNPLGCRAALEKAAKLQGVSLNVAVVLGDDVNDPALLKRHEPRELDTGAPPPESFLSASAYLGCGGVVAALKAGADVVITGRAVDSAMVLGPLVYEHNWQLSSDAASESWDLLAQGSLAGHLVECGAQVTGGLFTDWNRVSGWENMGFPIARCAANGDFEITKPGGTGGLVSCATVAEQLVYEIGDPSNYILPDVSCDFRQVELAQVGDDRVRVTGARGRPPTEYYKVAATYPEGYRLVTSFFVGGFDATAKAKRLGQALLDKIEALLNERGLGGFAEKRVDVLGSEGSMAGGRNLEPREAVLRMAVWHPQREALELMIRELSQAGTAMAPGLTGGVGGRPKPSARVRLYSFLLDKDAVKVEVDVGGERREVTVPEPTGAARSEGETLREKGPPRPTEHWIKVPLMLLAHGRSGDKGDHANIGIIARKPEFLRYIEAALSPSAVAEHMSHVLDTKRGKVEAYRLPGIHALNFLLRHSLGGGGTSSLRIDAQGKTYAQQLLTMEVPVPPDLLSR